MRMGVAWGRCRNHSRDDDCEHGCQNSAKAFHGKTPICVDCVLSGKHTNLIPSGMYIRRLRKQGMTATDHRGPRPQNSPDLARTTALM